jgi:hypothetical protein
MVKLAGRGLTVTVAGPLPSCLSHSKSGSYRDYFFPMFIFAFFGSLSFKNGTALKESLIIFYQVVRKVNQLRPVFF